MLQDALSACYECSGDLKEVHFVLFGSDTYDVWLAEANKHLKPVTDTGNDTQQGDVSRSSPAKDKASPMQGTTSPEQSPAAAEASKFSSNTEASKDDSAMHESPKHEP